MKELNERQPLMTMLQKESLKKGPTERSKRYIIKKFFFWSELWNWYIFGGKYRMFVVLIKDKEERNVLKILSE